MMRMFIFRIGCYVISIQPMHLKTRYYPALHSHTTKKQIMPAALFPTYRGNLPGPCSISSVIMLTCSVDHILI